jgi:hypothetical protein
MAKYHINPETGRPNQCTAKVQCRFGSEAQHFDSKESARAGYEKQMERQTVSGVLKKTSKTPVVPTGFSYTEVAAASEEIEKLSNYAVSLRMSNFSDEDGSELLVVFNAEHDLCMVIEQTDKGENLAYVAYGPDHRKAREPLSKVLTATGIDNLAQENDDYPHDTWEDGPSPASQQIVKIINDVVGERSAAETPAPAPAKPAPTAPAKLAVIPGVRPVMTNQEMDEEVGELHEELYGYSVRELLKARYIDLQDIQQEERSGNYAVTAKVPSYYEVSISTDLARRELGLPARQKTGIDEDELRLAEIKKNEAYSKTFGYFPTTEASMAANSKYKAAKEEFDKIREERRNSAK